MLNVLNALDRIHYDNYGHPKRLIIRKQGFSGMALVGKKAFLKETLKDKHLVTNLFLC